MKLAALPVLVRGRPIAEVVLGVLEGMERESEGPLRNRENEPRKINSDSPRQRPAGCQRLPLGEAIRLQTGWSTCGPGETPSLPVSGYLLRVWKT